MFPPLSIAAVTLVYIVACCVFDMRTRQIPNELSGGALLAGLILNASISGFAGLLGSVTGAVLCIGVLLAPFALGGVGGGDVKMMGAVGALLGPRLALAGLAAGMILGGVLMVAHLARIGRLREKLAATWSMTHRSVVERSTQALKVSDRDSGTVALPYSIPLGIGTIVILASAWQGRAM